MFLKVDMDIEANSLRPLLSLRYVTFRTPHDEQQMRVRNAHIGCESPRVRNVEGAKSPVTVGTLLVDNEIV